MPRPDRLPFAILMLLPLLFLSLTSLPALAAGTASVQPASLDASQLIAKATHYLTEQTSQLPGEVTVHVDPPDSRLTLTECSQPVFFLPPNGKLWGHTMLGVQCQTPHAWTVYLQASITVHGKYIVTTKPLKQGQAIDTSTLASAEGELTRLPADTLTDVSQATGKIMATSLPAGFPLRASQLRERTVIQPGQTVTVLSTGNGFTVSSEGKAVNAASAGQTVQVRMSSGEVVSGTANASGKVLAQ